MRDEQLARGRARMKQLAEQDTAKARAIATRIISELGRVPSQLDELAAMHIARLFVRAERLEEAGRNSSAVRQSINQAMRASGFRPDKPTQKKPTEDFRSEMLRLATPPAGGS